MKDFELTINTTFHKDVTVKADTIEEAFDKALNDSKMLDGALDTLDFETTVQTKQEEKKDSGINSVIIETITDKSDFYYQIGGQIYHITEGTGDNLSEEDIKEGYVDYIYYDVYDNIQGIANEDIVDGGMILLEKIYQDMSIQEILGRVISFIGPNNN